MTTARTWRLRSRPSGRDPLVLAVGLVALVTYTLHGFHGYLSRDLAIYAYAGQQVADGVPPYMGILNRAGPLAHLLPALGAVGARATGITDLFGIRLLYMGFAVLCVCAVYLLGRDVFASRLAGLAGATAFLTFSGFIDYASNGPREKTPLVLLLVLCFWAVHHRRWLAAGVALSLATLVLQLAFPLGFAAIIVTLVAGGHGERLRALARVVVGGLIPVVIGVVYFAWAGALHVAIEDYLLINARYTTSIGILHGFHRHWNQLRTGYGISLWILLIGLVALIILSLPALRSRTRRQNPAAVSVAALGAAAVVGLLWILRDFDGWPDAMLLLPLAAMGVAGLAKVAKRRLRYPAALSLILAWSIAAVAVAVSTSVTTRDETLVRQRHSVMAVLSQLPPDATILSVNSPQALVFSGKTNPTRFQTSTSGLGGYLNDTYPGGLTGFGRWVGQQGPTLITIGRRMPTWLAATLKADYERVGRTAGWQWYVKRSVGPDVVSDLQRKAKRWS